MATAKQDVTNEPGVRVRGGAFQVRVYAGVDPVTGKEIYETESTREKKQIKAIRARLQTKVDQQRTAATTASLAYLLGEWLPVHEIDISTRDTYQGYIDRTIIPAIGNVPISKITPQNLERFYADLRRCRVRCKASHSSSIEQTKRTSAGRWFTAGSPVDPLAIGCCTTTAARWNAGSSSASLTCAVRWSRRASDRFTGS